jgi:hypothetical protein
VSRREKQLQRLGSLRAEFIATLRGHLEEVARGYDTVFFGAERFDPFPNAYLRRQNRPIEAILSLGDEILALCGKLGEPPCPAVLALHRACQEDRDYSNPHRLGPARLAQRLLGEIETPAA